MALETKKESMADHLDSDKIRGIEFTHAEYVTHWTVCVGNCLDISRVF